MKTAENHASRAGVPATAAPPFAAWAHGLVTTIAGPYSDIRTRAVIIPGPEQIGRVAPSWRLTA